MRALVGLAVVLFVAGCLGASAPASIPDSGAPAAPTARPTMPATIKFALARVLGTMSGGAEPGIATAPDGTVYVTTPLALWRSDDGGKSYQPLGNPSCPANLPSCPGLEQYRPGVKGGGDADIWVTPDGRVHWLGLADGQNAIPYQVSSDKGQTWTSVVDLAAEDGADREWITSRADGTLFAAWRNFPSSGAAKIVMRASFDGGSTWGPRSDIADDTRQGGIAVDPTSNAIALAYDLRGKVSVARSMDNGTTWEHAVVVEDPLQGQVFPVTAYDVGGTLYAAFAHDRDGLPAVGTAVQNRPLEQTSVYLAASHDKGATWTKPVQVNPPGTTAWFPWITAGAAGRVVLAWYQNDRGLPRQITDEVYVDVGMSLDADMDAPHFKVVRASPDPVHRGPECRENPGCTRSLLDFFEVAIHPKGYPVLTWAQDTWPAPRVSVAATMMVEGPDMLH